MRSSTTWQRCGRWSSPSGCRRSSCPTTTCSPTGASCGNGPSRSTPAASRSSSGEELTPDYHRARHRLELSLPGQDGHGRHGHRHPPLPAEPRRAGACRAGPDRRRRPDRARARGRDQRPLAGEADHDSRARARHPRRPVQTGAPRRSAPPTGAARRRVRSRRRAHRRAREPAGHVRAVRRLDERRPHDRGRHLVSLLRAHTRQRLPPRRPRRHAGRRTDRSR